ncbi:hypothetical protein DSCW_53380 [Desulfosarcina widdelii]|uniref:Uncharacterized protein n=1 Tax=Desulfosarcina widdelii TaxID=947919 RepID=A0A5K7ZDW2_9BACT|nr:hypothetical protein [Desulfosarcina widdelii]BBO77921.1 hypothetical protein DSCW_53380 [Desulfosarcina widdelii]
MPAKKNVDHAKLIKMVQSGAHQSEIMKAFKFNTAAQFKTHYLNALIETGKAPEIKTGRTSSQTSAVKEVFVGKGGSVIISKDLVQTMGFAEGDKFNVRKTKAGISLKKIS